MTAIERRLLHKQILTIVLNTAPWDLYVNMNHCRSAGFGMGCNYVTFYPRQILPYIRKKIGFNISEKEVKKALYPLKKEDYFQVGS